MGSRMVLSSSIALVLFIVSHTASSQKINDPEIPCSTTAHCTTIPNLPPDARCVSGYCACTDENGDFQRCSMTHSQPKAAAVHRPVAAHPCTVDQDCTAELPNGYCNTGIKQCDCSNEYVMASDSYTCLRVARSVGASCDQSNQCSMANSTCRNNQCVCDTGFHYSENGCWRTVEIGKSCTVNQQCSHVSNAICNEQMMCTCANNTVLNSDRRRCLPVVKDLLGACLESVQCSQILTDAACIDKRCECKENNHFEQDLSRCVPSKHLGDACAEAYECYQDLEEGVAEKPQSCMEGVCTCNENFRKDGDKCVSSVASSFGPVFYMSLLLSALLFIRS